jgi:hypothetical protein
MSDYKIKVTWKKFQSNCSSSDEDNDGEDNYTTYTEYLNPNSTFVKKYCDDYGEVDTDGLEKLTEDKNEYSYDNHQATSATLIVDYRIKEDFLEANPPSPPPIRISCSDRPILSYEERLARNRKQIRCRFGDNCKYNVNGNCRYKH